ncbi:unnamed protein product [Fusarium langsethiae]|nr:unnamed protein product [Fusarium langsethiae]GKU13126.1 unnamed protein product [Fusarium langsethiae]
MAQDQDMSDSPRLPSSGTKTTIRSTETLADNADIPNIEMGSFVTRDSGSKQRPNYGSTAHVPTKAESSQMIPEPVPADLADDGVFGMTHDISSTNPQQKDTRQDIGAQHESNGKHV